MSEDPELQTRLDTFNRTKARAPRRRLTAGVLALGLSLCGAGVAYLLAINLDQDPAGLDTSDVEPFQDPRAGSGGRLEFPDEATEQRVSDALIAVEDALEVPTPEPAPPQAGADVLEELTRLREVLSASQTARNAEIQAAVGDLRTAFEAQTDTLQAAVSERDTRLAALERQSQARESSLQSLLEAEHAQRTALEAELENSSLIADQKLLEDRRRQEEAQRRQDAKRAAETLLTAQVTSPAIVYATGQGSTAAGGGSVASGSGTASGPDQNLVPVGENEAWLRRAAQPLQIDGAARMEMPQRTLSQGSVIQAALQTAINSDLPGSVIAVVSEPVLAFTGDQILIPRGARLFGQYRSGIEVSQKRILILWTRILTPDGTSMEIASVGGDPLGRSGMTGLVDTKFDERFGGAALISIIGAAPAVAATTSKNEPTSEVMVNVGDDLADATGAVISDQLSIAPTIYVDQGASVTVLVDRDIVIW